jgi:sporulation protein YlmC with PRC-barrel domain
MNEDRRAILSASSIAADPVANAAGDKIADVKDVMIDLATGRVAYLVISYGGFLGLGDKLFAVPWSVAKVDQSDQSIVIDLDEEILKTAPGFDPDHWPDIAQSAWNREIHEHYGVDEPWPLT